MMLLSGGGPRGRLTKPNQRDRAMEKGRKIRVVPPVKRIHYFGRLGSRRTQFSAERLGGKGASLAYMRSLGLPVPPGFTITTGVCTEYQEIGTLPDGLEADVKEALARAEQIMRLKRSSICGAKKIL